MIKKYIEQLQIEFEKRSSKEDSIYMSNYLRNQFICFGLKTPERKAVQKNFLKEFIFPGNVEFRNFINLLWDQPQREYQYSAMDFMDKFIKNFDKDYIEFVEILILKKSWWDTVDMLSAKFAGYIFKKNPELIKPITGKWMKSGNIWLQRSSLLFQLKYKSNTDENLLYLYCKDLSGSKEFFLQKAIGWVLREYSKTNPESVIQFIHSNKLSNLSVKEGLKHINKS